jgi:CheY-like chemotaxis protein
MKKDISVLFIDDNEIDLFINKSIAKTCGLNNILTFRSAINALEYLRKTKKLPLLVFLDINLPIMNGEKFLNEFHKLEIAKQSVDVFILSGSINPMDKELAREKNCTDFIEKPLTISKFSVLLDNIGKSFATKC